MQKTQDYTGIDSYKEILESEKTRQKKDEPVNIKVRAICSFCKKPFERWLFDPGLKSMTCSFRCEMASAQKDFFDKNSEKLKHECYMCGKTFLDDKIISGKTRESAEVDRACLVCSDSCKKRFDEMFEKQDHS